MFGVSIGVCVLEQQYSSFRKLRESLGRKDVAVVKYYQSYDSTRNSGIGKVENRLEEKELLSADPRHPRWPYETEQREVEHVDHTSEENRGVASAGRKERGHLRRRGIIENESIEDTIEYVARCACDDECQADEIAARDGAQCIDFDYVPYQESDGDYSEQGQRKFASKFHPEGHSVVFDEIQIEPREDFDIFPEIEMGLNPDFRCLVENHHEDCDDEDECSSATHYSVSCDMFFAVG